MLILAKPMFLTIAVVVVFTLCDQSCAQISSTFDNDLDGWTLSGGSSTDLAFNPSGGNPGGFLRSFGSSPATLELVAPLSFLGDLSVYDGGTFSFDSLNSESFDSTLPSFGTITITGSTGTASRDIVEGGLSFPNWETNSTSLIASEWGVTQNTWDSILSDVTRISIDVSAQSDLVDIGIDNIAINAVPEPSSSLLLGLTALMLGMRRRHRSAC